MLNTACPRKHNGFSLVELMIAITVGLVIVTGVLTLFLSAVRSNSDNLRTTRLNQDLRSAMAVMVRDIRRAGAWARAADSVVTPAANPFTSTATTTDLTINDLTANVTGNCITYTYDNPPFPARPDPSNVDSGEYYGFKLNSSAVQMRTGGASAGSHGCTAGSWESLTDPATTTITALTFARRETTVPLGGGGNRIIRDVTITMTGTSASDATVSRTLIENVRIPNDRYN
ncbi:MAG: prepilin-type N-terminal cleavage/methylation domain-containing protein [Gammaproteobacteria bacterium]|nr:prepilin-type N-terminal cleavage/methylation domain-containing protein [Gammaproteobacteria bacterium]